MGLVPIISNFKTVQECQSVQFKFSGGALAKQGLKKGVYVKADKENGKLSWTTGRNALWWRTKGLWVVGPKESIGSDKYGLRARRDLPYPSLSNQWEYFDGKKWVKSKNEISVKCTSFETVGKY